MNNKLYAWVKEKQLWYLVRDLANINVESYREILKSMGYCTCLIKMKT